MLFLTNPPRRTVRLNKPKGARKSFDPIVSNKAGPNGTRIITTKSGKTWTISTKKKKGAAMATKKRKSKSKGKGKSKPRARKRSTSKWSSRTARKTPAKARKYRFRKSKGKRGRVFRTNPPRLSVNSMVTATVEGAKDAVAVIAGQVATRFIRSKIPVSGGTMVQTGLGVASALAAGYLAGMVMPRYARTVIAGGLSDVIRPFLANVPVVGEGLAGDGDALGIGADSFLGLGAYDNSGGMGAYPALSGDSFIGAYTD